MSGADDYEHALGGLRGHIVYGEQTAGDTPVAWVQVKVALPYLRNAERVLVAERARAEAAEAECARLRAIVESVRAARAVSTAAATRYTAAWDAVGTMPPTPAQSEEIAAALLAAYEAGDALTAALDAAGEGR